MFSRNHGKAQPFNRGSTTRQRLALNGLFADGIWQCNCDPRLPADRFQCKNGQVNHGRWFYKCQKPRPKGCGFFLWDSEAKVREGKTVLNNSRTEPQTPTKQNMAPPITPNTDTQDTSTVRADNPIPISPTFSQAETASPTTPTEFDWPESDYKEMSKIADTIAMPAPLPETPRKAMKTDTQSTPGKRKHDETWASATAWPTPSKAEDVFSNPPQSTSKNLFSAPTTAPITGLPSPNLTPTPNRLQTVLPAQDSPLATEILSTLSTHSISLPPPATASIKEICHRYTMKTQGIEKGREITRQAVKNKDGRIAELLGKVAGLEAERETLRGVVGSLRRDLERIANVAATSGRGRGRGSE